MPMYVGTRIESRLNNVVYGRDVFRVVLFSRGSGPLIFSR